MATRQNYFCTGTIVDGEWPAIGYDNSYVMWPGPGVDVLVYAQNFIAAASYTIGSVRLPLGRAGTPGTVTVKIYAVNGTTHKPTGTALASGTTNGNTLTDAWGWTWRTITLTTNPALTSGTEYSIVVSCAGADESNYVFWWYNDGTVPIVTPPAAQRYSFMSEDGGTTWSLLSILTGINYEAYDSYTFAPPVGGPTKRQLIAAAADSIWVEDI